jgi:tRNA dimethylallyltransferase
VDVSQPLPPLLVICGPTATGKTRLSLSLAQAMPGAEIISADSRQVYRGMDIGTAKVTTAERTLVPHHGLDVVDPDQRFGAADFRRVALQALRAIARRGGMAILVGGTGLYLRAIARGLPLEEGAHNVELRSELEARLAREGLPALAVELARIAPTVAAATDRANPRRVVRALERARVHGDQLPPPAQGYPAPHAWVGLDVALPVNDDWIVTRARRQFSSGLLEEAAGLRRRYDPTLPAFSAVGYREAFAVLDGAVSVDEAVARTALRTRQFARRQRTWFRTEPGVEWLDASAGTHEAALTIARRMHA